MSSNENWKIAGADKKITAGILAILLGGLGIHKFILGYRSAGLIMLLVSILGAILILPTVVMSIIGLVEGIIYLTKDDEDFVRQYIDQEKAWF